MPRKPTVLFACTHNAGRSQMAAAFLSHYAGDSVVVESAGSEPVAELHPAVVVVMRERGIDLEECMPRLLTTEMAAAADLVVTMGCGEACPRVPGVRTEEWDVPDPAAQCLEQVRAIRDMIDARVQHLLRNLPELQSDGASG